MAHGLNALVSALAPASDRRILEHAFRGLGSQSVLWNDEKAEDGNGYPAAYL